MLTMDLHVRQLPNLMHPIAPNCQMFRLVAYVYYQRSQPPWSPIDQLSEQSLHFQKSYWYGSSSMLQGHARVYLKPICSIEGRSVC